MSTAPEAIIAAHAGMEVLGFSLLTNMALLEPGEADEVSHEEVLEVGAQAAPRLVALVKGILERLK
jgi:purine-nucleoside phosphorylase